MKTLRRFYKKIFSFNVIYLLLIIAIIIIVYNKIHLFEIKYANIDAEEYTIVNAKLNISHTTLIPRIIFKVSKKTTIFDLKDIELMNESPLKKFLLSLYHNLKIYPKILIKFNFQECYFKIITNYNEKYYLIKPITLKEFLLMDFKKYLQHQVYWTNDSIKNDINDLVYDIVTFIHTPVPFYIYGYNNGIIKGTADNINWKFYKGFLFKLFFNMSTIDVKNMFGNFITIYCKVSNNVLSISFHNYNLDLCLPIHFQSENIGKIWNKHNISQLKSFKLKIPQMNENCKLFNYYIELFHKSSYLYFLKKYSFLNPYLFYKLSKASHFVENPSIETEFYYKYFLPDISNYNE